MGKPTQAHIDIMYQAYKSGFHKGPSKLVQDICDQGLMEFMCVSPFNHEQYFKLTEKGKQIFDNAIDKYIDNLINLQ